MVHKAAGRVSLTHKVAGRVSLFACGLGKLQEGKVAPAAFLFALYIYFNLVVKEKHYVNEHSAVKEKCTCV